MRHIAAPRGEVYWRHALPESPSSKMILLTVGGVAVVGTWYGQLDQYFQAWCPMPKVDKPQ